MGSYYLKQHKKKINTIFVVSHQTVMNILLLKVILLLLGKAMIVGAVGDAFTCLSGRPRN